jgi:hypothetical protein
MLEGAEALLQNIACAQTRGEAVSGKTDARRPRAFW